MLLFFTGSHQVFSDVTSLLACTGSQCVFCQKKELANNYHLYTRHLRDAVYFFENNEGMYYSLITERYLTFQLDIVMPFINVMKLFLQKNLWWLACARTANKHPEAITIAHIVNIKLLHAHPTT